LNITTDDLDTLARTLYGESEPRDESDAYAIAHVIMNRVREKRWPDDISGVCLQPKQFSCWNGGEWTDRLRKVSTSDRWLRRCMEIAKEVASGEHADPTMGSNHYFATYIAPPRWARHALPVYHTPFGDYNHWFFKL
jgi:spore germination cell wall hydrolase CwlJ-like protein